MYAFTHVIMYHQRSYLAYFLDKNNRGNQDSRIT